MNQEFSKEFLDDFYAECDELLSAIRDSLALVEQGLKSGRTAGEIESLFRSVHSLKGISAIAGVAPAEQLSHRMEDLLRFLFRGQVQPTAQQVDVLMATAHRLEQILGSHRMGSPIPATRDLEQALQNSTPTTTPSAAPISTQGGPTAAGKTTPDPVADARSRGLQPWLCSFSPSREFDERGVNVAGLRGRLNAIGEILSATPVVQPGGSITFNFVVGLKKSPENAEIWAADGVRFSPIGGEETREASEEAPAEAPVDTSASLFLTPSHMVRVDLARLDDVMRITGEMVIQRSQLEERLKNQSTDAEALNQTNLALARSLKELRGAISRVRMVPIAEIFNRMPFVVQDLNRAMGKNVRLKLEGHQTEIDKYLVERLKEPLLHLVRNAYSHGIETQVGRIKSGKSIDAVITLRASNIGDSILIQVKDDGRGIDPAAIMQRAASLGIKVPEVMDERGILTVLCAPGFSTRDEADLASGRGVGMAVVANTVRELGGSMTLRSTPGEGTEFALRLPLTLSIVDSIIVRVGTQTCAVPQGDIEEIIQIPALEARSIQSTEVIPYRDGLLPILRLRAVFAQEGPSPGNLTVLVVTSERGSTGIVVDQVVSKKEVVVRPLTDPLVRVRGVSGATELGDGRPILILDPNALGNSVVRPKAALLASAASAN